MKKLITTLMLMGITTICLAQKPMVGFTEDEIKTYNKIEFSTASWDKTYESEIWCLWTKHTSFDLMSFYVFKYGETKNVMFTNATQDDEMALLILDQVRENSVYKGDNKYYDKKTGLTVECKYDKNKNIDIPRVLVEYPIEYIDRPDREEALHKLQLDPAKKHILHVGLYTSRKNQVEFFEYARSMPECEFHSLGNRADNFKWYSGNFPIFHEGEGTVHDSNLVKDWNNTFSINSLKLAKKHNSEWYRWKLSNNYERAVFLKGDSVFPRETQRYQWANHNGLPLTFRPNPELTT